MQSLFKLCGINISPIKEIESFGLLLGWGWAGLVLLLIFVLPILYFSYRCEGKSLQKKSRHQLIAIRLVWGILLTLLLASPILVVSGYVPQRNRIAMMVDTSRSMSIKYQNESRLDQIKKLFESGFNRRLEEKTGVYPEVFAFSDNVSPVSRQEVEQFNFSADGNHTDLSGAVRDVMGNLGEGSMLGIIMLTDGTSTMGENPAIALSNMRTPVYFIGPGAQGETADMALHLPKPPALGYLNSSVRVRGEVSLHRIATTAVEIIVTRNNQPFTKVQANFAPETGRADFAFNIPCDEEGTMRFELEIPPLKNELTTENNRAGFLLKVVRERLNILALSGRPSWDMKFISNALSTDPNAKIVHWLKVMDGRWICSRYFKPEKAVTTPDMNEDLKIADVIVLNDASYDMLKPVEEELIRRVEAGTAGLLVLPSTRTFAELGYQGTLLEKLLPVNCETQTWRGTPGNMVLPAVDVPYNFLRLVDNPIENVEFFATLPKLDGAYEFSGLKPGCEVLISSTIRGSREMLPLMIKSRVGQGNIVMIAGGPIWPMGFRLVPTDRGFAPFSGFMVNMFKWLANRREDAKVSLEMGSSRGYVGQASNIKVWVMDSKNQLQPNAQVSLQIKDEKGNSNMLPAIETSEKGCYETTFVPAFRGLYKIEADARYQGRELGRAAGEILVETPTAEFDEPVVKEALMKQLASDTGGLFANVDQAADIISAIEAVPGQKLETKTIDLRDSWLLLIILLLLPMIEWYLRRVRGLS